MTKDELILDDCLKALEYMANKESPGVCDSEIRAKALLDNQQGEALDFVLQEEYIGDFALFVGLDNRLKNGASKVLIEDLLVMNGGRYAPKEFIKHCALEEEFEEFYAKQNIGLIAQKEEL